MEKQLEKIEDEITQKIYKLFLEKFGGNKSAFAKAIGCSETTVRRILRKEQGITVNLLLRMVSALDTDVSELFKNLAIKKES